jgi:post-segregation antitoxin (ccd killing protein)
MRPAKRRVSISLDEDLVRELQRRDQGISTQINSALRAEVERRCRDRLLLELLDRLDGEHGPVDESLIEKYAGLLE